MMKSLYILILYIFCPILLIGQSDYRIYPGNRNRKEYLVDEHKQQFDKFIFVQPSQKFDSIYSFMEKTDIIKLLGQNENILMCNKPLQSEQIIYSSGNMVASIMLRMHGLNYWEIGEKSFAEMSYAVLDTIIYDKPFTRWDTEKISKLYMEKIKQKKRKERKRFNLTFIECQEPLMDYSTNKFHKKISTSLPHLFLTVSIEPL